MVEYSRYILGFSLSILLFVVVFIGSMSYITRVHPNLEADFTLDYVLQRADRDSDRAQKVLENGLTGGTA